MEIARDEVRVMTVHGAKGLEAPIVILADTMTPPAGPRPPRLLELAGGAVIWAGRKDDDVPAVAAARQAALAEAENEYRRLLYVAMTRAADRLIVCGADGERKRPDGLLVRSRARGARAVSGRGRRGRRKGPALSQGGARCRRPIDARQRTSRRRPRAPRFRHGCASRLPRRPRPATVVAVLGVRRGDRPHSRARRLGRRSPQGACTRAHRAPADAVVARYSAGRPQGRRRALSRTAPRQISLPPSRRRSRGNSSPSSTIRTLPKSSRRAAAPRCRLSAASPARRRDPIAVSPVRSTAWRSRRDAVLIADYKTDRAVPARGSTTCRNPISPSSRSTGPFWRASIRKKRFAPR